jgi:hypothetical protein
MDRWALQSLGVREQGKVGAARRGVARVSAADSK